MDLQKRLRRLPVAARRQTGWYMRLMTAPRRALPDFLIIGAQKSGTSSLYNHLLEHPLIAAPLRKEVHYFDHNHFRGQKWYRAHFTLARTLEGTSRTGGNRRITGEASPSYLLHPLAAERTAGLLPGAKLIVLLRNPIARAYSHYQHKVTAQREKLPFVEALALEEARIQGEREKLLRNQRYDAKALFDYSYLTRGIYADQLRLWYDHFPREQMLVLRAEDFFADTPAAVHQVVGFLGLQQSDWAPQKLDASNVGSYHEPMASDVRAQLAEYYAPHNDRLYRLVGRDFGWT
jgi:hypothetical protein